MWRLCGISTDLCASASIEFWRNLPLRVSLLDSPAILRCTVGQKGPVQCLYIFKSIPLGLEVSLTCLEHRFTRWGPSESYDANVSHFLLHTSSLIRLLLGSIQVGSAQHCFWKQWQPWDYLYKFCLCSLPFSRSFYPFSPCFGCFLRLCPHSPVLTERSLPSLSLSVLQQEVSCHVDIVVWSSQGLEGINPGKTHFYQPCNLWE